MTTPQAPLSVRSEAEVARGNQIFGALKTLRYTRATEDSFGWVLQAANECTCKDHPPAPELTFAIFWVALPAFESADPPQASRSESDGALAGIALDLQLLGFKAVAQGVNMQHGGFAAVLVEAP